MRLADYIGKYWAGAEVMYAVIIAMTFTSVLRNYSLDSDAVVNMAIYSALFCCIAWGIADGVFYAWERSYIIRQENRIIELSKSPENSESAITIIRDELDDTILRNVRDEDRTALYSKLVNYLSDSGTREKASIHDELSIIAGTLISSTLACVLVILPFFVIDDLKSAINISNLVCILLLFMAGYFRALDGRWQTKLTYGLSTSFIGVIIAMITVVLGG